MQPRRPRPRLIIELVLLIVLGVALFNYNGLADAYARYHYHPTTEMASLESTVGLTNYASGIFARAYPVIDTKTAFNTDCQTVKGELELGCFTNNKIYVLKIDNASLAPEMEVVTAHELLHAAYVRLSGAQKLSLNAELEAAYAKINDPDLTARMASYAAREPGERDNELHSILGTEYASLSPELEAHYSRYFTNRTAIVAAQATYANVFASRRQELAAQLDQIHTLKGQLTAINQRLEAYRAAGKIASYNALIPAQNQLVDTINGLIDTYQKGADEYNSLSKSLDSTQITATETPVQ